MPAGAFPACYLTMSNIHWANIFTSVGTVGAVVVSLILVMADTRRRGQQAKRIALTEANSVTYEIYTPTETRSLLRSGFPDFQVPAGLPGIKVTNGGDRPIFEVCLEVSVDTSADDEFDRWHWRHGDGTVNVVLADQTKLLEGYPAGPDGGRSFPTIPPSARRRIHPIIRWRDSEATRWEKHEGGPAKRLAGGVDTRN